MESKIIVVDDEPAVLGYTKELLSLNGYQVEACSNGNDALNTFKNNPAQYRLVITDQTMPNMLGTELIQKMQAIHPVKAILCTGFSEHVDHNNARQLGASEFIMKPFDAKQLLVAVEKIVQ